MSGKKSRSKGYRREREIVLRLREAGLDAQRVPLSGAARGGFSGDVVTTDSAGRKWTLEVKARADGWRGLRAWLQENDALVLVADRAEPLILTTFGRWLSDRQAK